MGGGAPLTTDYRLLEVLGPERGDFWPVTEKPLVIGRSAECDIVVLDPYVSRKQCEVWRLERAVQLRNLSRSNPTVVNDGLMLEPMIELQVGDVIVIGPCRFLLEKSLSKEDRPLHARRKEKARRKDRSTLFIRQLP